MVQNKISCDARRLRKAGFRVLKKDKEHCSIMSAGTGKKIIEVVVIEENTTVKYEEKSFKCVGEVFITVRDNKIVVECKNEEICSI